MIKDDSSRVRLLLIGFGRMGVTHLSIFSGLLNSTKLEVVIVDNSFVSRRLAKEVMPSAKVFRSVSAVSASYSNACFDFCIITTPPIDRPLLIEEAASLSKRVFIEKPLMVPLGTNQMSGYVLQHSPLNREVFELMSTKPVSTIVGQLTTNLSFSSVEKGWRAGKFGSVLYEFGGHLLTVIATTCGIPEFLSKQVEAADLIVDELHEDLVSFRFRSCGIDVVIQLIAGSPDVRKASYDIELSTDNEKYTYDLYSLRRRSTNGESNDDVLLNVASRDTTVPFYVRGFEFSAQMQAFLNDSLDVLSISQIDNVENIIGRVS